MICEFVRECVWASDREDVEKEQTVNNTPCLMAEVVYILADIHFVSSSNAPTCPGD